MFHIKSCQSIPLECRNIKSSTSCIVITVQLAKTWAITPLLTCAKAFSFVSYANTFESLFVEICIPRHRNIVIGVIYRPPSENTLEFVEEVNKIISVTKNNKRCYITGADFNLDLLKHESHSVTAHFIESLFALVFCH